MPKTKDVSPLVYAAALTSGVLLALAAQILLGRVGIELAGVWRGLFTTPQAQLTSAIAWWLIAVTAFVGGFAVTLALTRFSWLFWRALRWVLGLALVFGLATVGHWATVPDSIASSGQLAASLAASFLAALMAAIGSYFAARP